MLAGALPFRGDYEQAVVYSILNEEPEAITNTRSDVPDALQRIVGKALAKNPDKRYQAAIDLLQDLKPLQAGAAAPAIPSLSIARFLLRPKVAIPATLVVCALAAGSFMFIKHQARYAGPGRNSCPRSRASLMRTTFGATWDRPSALRAGREDHPNDPRLAGLFSKCSLKISIRTEPAGARVYMKEYETPDNEWLLPGRVAAGEGPAAGRHLRWKLEKEGFETVLATASTWKTDIRNSGGIIPLRSRENARSIGKHPRRHGAGDGAETEVGRLDDFFIDRCEVTNRQFRKFVDAAVTRTRNSGSYKFFRDGKKFSWEEALKVFVDQTGQPGPRPGRRGTFRKDREITRSPASSWYEAAGLRGVRGQNSAQRLSLGDRPGRGYADLSLAAARGIRRLRALQQFPGQGHPAGRQPPGITAIWRLRHGGKRREWCWNETPSGRLIRGGAWDDNPYMFGKQSQAPPWSARPAMASAARLSAARQNPRTRSRPSPWPVMVDLYKMKPGPGSGSIRSIKSLYAYTRRPAGAGGKPKGKSRGWTLEKVSFRRSLWRRAGHRLPLPTAHQRAPYQGR